MKDPILYAINKLILELEKRSSQSQITLGLSGGTSLSVFYDLLEDVLSFLPRSILDKLNFVYLDERDVETSNSESNYKLTKDLFLGSLVERKIIKETQIKLLNSDTYTTYLDKNGIDLAFFGVGEDGHIASIFPSLYNEWNFEKDYTKIINSPKEPLERYSITPKGLEKVDLSFLFFIGEKKRGTYEKYKLGLLENSPVTLLKNIEVITNIQEKRSRK